MSKSDLEACIQEVKNGNSQQFEYIINLYQKNIYRYIRYMIHNDRDVDDIVQEVFVKVYINIKKYKAQSNFEGWLYRIAYNTTMNVLKKRSREDIVPSDELPELSYEVEVDQGFSPDVLNALSRLTMDERTLVYHRVYEEMSYKEIGKIMGASSGALRKKFERARHKFMNHFEEVPCNG